MNLLSFPEREFFNFLKIESGPFRPHILLGILSQTFDSNLYIYQLNIALTFLQIFASKNPFKVRKKLDFRIRYTHCNIIEKWFSKPLRFSRIWFTRGMDNFERNYAVSTRVKGHLLHRARRTRSPRDQVSVWHAFPDRGNFVKTCSAITT